MEKSVSDITIKIRNQNKGMTTTEVNDVYGTFFVKLCDLNIEKIFNTQLPLNEDKNNFDEKLNDINYKKNSDQ